MTRNVLPSMRARAVSVFGLPVQWRVPSAFRRSAIDQMLKYGSCATSGTAGGLMGAGVCPGAASVRTVKKSPDAAGIVRSLPIVTL